MDPEKKPVEVYAERGESKMPEASPEEMKALALAYAKYLAENDLEPGEPTFTDSIPDLETEIAQAADPETEPVKSEISEPAEETVQSEVSETAEAGGKDDSDKAETGKGVKKKKEKKEKNEKRKGKRRICPSFCCCAAVGRTDRKFSSRA